MPKTAVVTGAMGSLGRAAVRMFAGEGYEVHLTAISEEERADYDGPGIVTTLNLTDLEAVKIWASGIGGPVHAAALIAGGFSMESLDKMRAGDFDMMFDMNAKTAAHTLSALVPMMTEAKGASIALIGAQVHEGVAGMALYAASKAAVASLTRSAALELHEKEIRVNALLPNIIDTPANRKAMPSADFNDWAKPEEIAEVIRFLCSDAGSVITGNLIKVGRYV